jgi:hypothetical protein
MQSGSKLPSIVPSEPEEAVLEVRFIDVILTRLIIYDRTDDQLILDEIEKISV